MPAINLFSGGKHAGGQTAIQDVQVVAHGASSMSQALAMTYDVYQSAAKLNAEKYGVRALKPMRVDWHLPSPSGNDAP